MEKKQLSTEDYLGYMKLRACLGYDFSTVLMDIDRIAPNIGANNRIGISWQFAVWFNDEFKPKGGAVCERILKSFWKVPVVVTPQITIEEDEKPQEESKEEEKSEKHEHDEL